MWERLNEHPGQDNQSEAQEVTVDRGVQVTCALNDIHYYRNENYKEVPLEYNIIIADGVLADVARQSLRQRDMGLVSINGVFPVIK